MTAAASQAGPGHVTVGVVIDLPEPHATVIRGWRGRSGDPQGPVIPPHVTLLAPMSIRREAMDAAVAHLHEVAAGSEPFSMHLAGTDSFRPTSQVVFVQVVLGDGECKRLESAIRRGPLDRPREYPYHPHVTVAHDVEPSALDEAHDGLSDFVARFRVTQFALFTRESGAWTEQQMFTLGQQERT